MNCQDESTNYINENIQSCYEDSLSDMCSWSEFNRQASDESSLYDMCSWGEVN